MAAPSFLVFVHELRKSGCRRTDRTAHAVRPVPDMGTQGANCLPFSAEERPPAKATYGRASRSLTTSPLERPALPGRGAAYKENTMKKSTCLAGALVLGLILPAAGLGASLIAA